MLNDQRRTSCYAALLGEAVASTTSAEELAALDLGAGTGLLSMLLARKVQAIHGVQKQLDLVAVEAEPRLAALAERLIEANDLQGTIKVHNVLSQQLGPGLPPDVGDAGAHRRAQLCIHEVFGSDPLSERILPALRHARRQLLSETCQLVPSKVTLLCALCQAGRLSKAMMPPSSLQIVRCVGEAYADIAPLVEAFPLRSTELPPGPRTGQSSEENG
eukprot:TRINITY_DN23599_c0_g2_i2.p1 TRINITY_DN23599_c0_g2~~TRINITY_DN23599_c0_g2_i2.p1  ORF type:complete len:217 (-),score=50.19 TRINITY_DN23599_c0_g2_i2:383-1033(-)